SLQRKKHRRRDGDDDRTGRGVFFRESKNRAAAFAPRRYRAGISEIGPAESNLERRRSATVEAGDGTHPRDRARPERANPQNAQAEIDALFIRGADDRTAHG